MSLGPVMIDLAGQRVSPSERDWLAHPAIGGVILFSRNFGDRQQLTELVAEIHAVRTPPLLVAVDQEGGRVQRFRQGFTSLPPMRALGRLFDAKPREAVLVAERFGWLMAAELRACGVDMSFAPVVDLDRGLAEVIGDRALHPHADAVSQLAAAFLAGMRSAGMVGTAKHFPTHAGAVADSHKALAVDNRDYPELIDDLAPYRHLIAHGLHAVMVSHVVFPRLDPRPASLSDWWIRTQLRTELEFTGAVISDDLHMAGLASFGDMVERALLAVGAGSDVVLVCNDADAVSDVLLALERHNDPAGQLRRMRLRAATSQDWEQLTALTEWDEARALVAGIGEPRPLELES